MTISPDIARLASASMTTATDRASAATLAPGRLVVRNPATAVSDMAATRITVP